MVINSGEGGGKNNNHRTAPITVVNMTQAFSPLEQMKPRGLPAVTGGSVASYPHIQGRENTAGLKIITLGAKSLVDKEKMGNFPENLAEDMLAVGNLILKINPVGYGDVDPKQTTLNDWMLINANVSSSYSDLTVFPVNVLETTLAALNKIDQFTTTSAFQDFLFHVLVQNKSLYMKTPRGSNVAVDSPLKKLTRCVFPDSIAAFNRKDMPIVFGNNTLDTSAFTCGIVTSEMNVPIRMKKANLFGAEKLETNDCNLFVCLAPSPDILVDYNRSSDHKRAMKRINRRAIKMSFNYRGMEDVGWKMRQLKHTMETVYDSSLAVTYWLEPVGNTMHAVESQAIQRCLDHGPRHPDTVQYKEVATIKIARVSATHQSLPSFTCSGVEMTEIRAYEIDMGTEWNVVPFSYPPESTAGFGAYTLGEVKPPFGSMDKDDSISASGSQRRAIEDLFATTSKSMGPINYSKPTYSTAFPTTAGGGCVGAQGTSAVSRRHGGDSVLPTSTRLINVDEESTLYNLVDPPETSAAPRVSPSDSTSKSGVGGVSFGSGRYTLPSSLSVSTIGAETDVNELISTMLLPTTPDPSVNELLVSVGDLPKNLPEQFYENMSEINSTSVDILRQVNEMIAYEVGRTVHHHQEDYQREMIQMVDNLDKLIDNHMDYVATIPSIQNNVKRVKELQAHYRKTTQTAMLELMRIAFDTMLKLREIVLGGLERYKILQKGLFSTFAKSNAQALIVRIENAAAAEDNALLKTLEIEWQNIEKEMDEMRERTENESADIQNKMRDDMRKTMHLYMNLLEDKEQSNGKDRESIMRRADDINRAMTEATRQHEREMYERNMREEDERYRRSASMYSSITGHDSSSTGGHISMGGSHNRGRSRSRSPLYQPRLTVKTGSYDRTSSPSPPPSKHSSLVAAATNTITTGPLTVLSSGSTSTNPRVNLVLEPAPSVILGGGVSLGDDKSREEIAGTPTQSTTQRKEDIAADEDEDEDQRWEAKSDEEEKQEHFTFKVPSDRYRTGTKAAGEVKQQHKKHRGRSASSKRNTASDGKKIEVLFSGKVGDE